MHTLGDNSVNNRASRVSYNRMTACSFIDAKGSRLLLFLIFNEHLEDTLRVLSCLLYNLILLILFKSMNVPCIPKWHEKIWEKHVSNLMCRVLYYIISVFARKNVWCHPYILLEPISRLLRGAIHVFFNLGMLVT